MKRLVCLLLVLACAFAFSVPAFADADPDETLYPELAAEAADPGIVITKDPWSELAVPRGGSTSFIAFADGYTSFFWEVLTADGTFTVPDLRETYRFVDLENETSTRLSVRNVSYDMYGWKFRCVFVNDNGEVPTAWAELRVVEPVSCVAPCAALRHHPPEILPDPYGGTPLPTSCGATIIIAS